MSNKITNFILKQKNSIKRWGYPMAIVLVLALTTVFAFAATPSATNILGKILDTIFTLASYIGVLLLAWGGVMLFLAIRNEDADSKSRAIMLLVVAIALICLGTLFTPVLQQVIPNYSYTPKEL